ATKPCEPTCVAVTNSSLSGWKATATTGPGWRNQSVTATCDVRSQTRAVRSTLPVRTRFESGLIANATTAFLCRNANGCSLDLLARSQTTTLPSGRIPVRGKLFRGRGDRPGGSRVTFPTAVTNRLPSPLIATAQTLSPAPRFSYGSWTDFAPST